MILGLVPILVVAAAPLITGAGMYVLAKYVLEPQLQELAKRGGTGAAVGAFVGNQIARVKTNLATYLAPKIRVGADWLDDLTGAANAEGNAIMATFAAIINTLDTRVFDRLWHPTRGDVPLINARHTALRNNLLDAKTGLIPALRTRIGTLERRLLDPETGLIPGLQRELGQITRRLFHPETGIIPRLSASLDKLRADVFNPEHGAIPQLKRGLATLEERIFDPERGAIPGIRNRLGRAEAKTDTLTDYFTPVMALAAAPAIAAAVETLLDNEPKLRRFCSMEPRDFDAAFLFTNVLPPWALIYSTMQLGARGTREAIEDMSVSLPFGPS